MLISDDEPILNIAEGSVTIASHSKFPQDLRKQYLNHQILFKRFGKKMDVQSIMIKAPSGLVNFMHISQVINGFPNRNELIKCCVIEYMKQKIEGWNRSLFDEYDEKFDKEIIRQAEKEIAPFVDIWPDSFEVWEKLRKQHTSNKSVKKDGKD